MPESGENVGSVGAGDSGAAGMGMGVGTGFSVGVAGGSMGFSGAVLGGSGTKLGIDMEFGLLVEVAVVVDSGAMGALGISAGTDGRIGTVFSEVLLLEKPRRFLMLLPNPSLPSLNGSGCTCEVAGCGAGEGFCCSGAWLGMVVGAGGLNA